MTFFQLYFLALIVIMSMMIILWIISIRLKNVSIVDLFWGLGFIVTFSDLMIALIIKVSGVALLEKALKETKPEYREYVEKTSAFIPWFPKK
jgi:steroid 5-alpha reductase family enzyme